MSEFQIVEVFGIRVDARCASLLEVVINLGGSNNVYERERAKQALEKMGEYGCSRAMSYVAQQFGGSNNVYKRELAKRALELI